MTRYMQDLFNINKKHLLEAIENDKIQCLVDDDQGGIIAYILDDQPLIKELVKE